MPHVIARCVIGEMALWRGDAFSIRVCAVTELAQETAACSG